MAARPSQSLNRDRRIRRRPEFTNVFDSGARTQGRYFTLLAAATGLPTMRLGIVASRKLGNAVRRNRAKRLIREVFRRTSFGAASLDLVVIPRRELFDVPYASLEVDFRSAFERCAARASARRPR